MSDAYEPVHLGPITVHFSVEAEDSDGSVTVSRCDVPAGAGVPFAHSHDAFEETIYGIEGTVTFTIDGEGVDIGPGDAACIRRGQVHSFVAGEDDVSILAVATPGVFGRAYFQDMAGVFAAAAGGPPDPEAVHAVMLRHGLTPAAPSA
jgi:quercetin dioxygenase-like cupin family protein